MTMPDLKRVTPGELLREEFLLPMGISQYRLAKEIGVPAQRIGEIVAGRRAITADTDLRLCRFFGLSNGYWLRAQAAYDIEIAEEALADQLTHIKTWPSRRGVRDEGRWVGEDGRSARGRCSRGLWRSDRRYRFIANAGRRAIAFDHRVGDCGCLGTSGRPAVLRAPLGEPCY
jgi:addiction module HigA family antidote